MNKANNNKKGQKKSMKNAYDIDFFIKKNELQNQVLEKIIKKINQSPKSEEKNNSNKN